MVARVSLDLGIALVGAVGVGAAALVWSRTGREGRGRLRRRAAVGVVAGLAATGAYDLLRLGVVTAFGMRFWPFDIFSLFGQLLVGSSAPPTVRLAAGVAYHWTNGVGFALAYVFLFRRPQVWTALLWALALELAMISIYPSWLHLKALDEFYTVSALGHLAYGSVLGLVSGRLLRPSGESVSAHT